MKVADLYKNKAGKPAVSFEFFRAKTPKAAESLEKVLDLLAITRHNYMSVTFGAGGTNREGSYELIDKIKKDRGLNVVAYIAGIGLGPDDLTNVLDTFKEQGIKTVFVIQGDKPQEEEFTPHPAALPHASDLLSFIKNRYDFCLGAAGYPEGHIVDDKEGVVQFGIDLATKQCRDLLRHGVPGLHFYTMNRGKSVHDIVTTLQKEGLV